MSTLKKKFNQGALEGVRDYFAPIVTIFGRPEETQKEKGGRAASPAKASRRMSVVFTVGTSKVTLRGNRKGKSLVTASKKEPHSAEN